MALTAAVVGNVIPIAILLAQHRSEYQQLPVVVLGAILAVLAPIAVTLLPTRCQGLLRTAAFSGIIGLTLIQADAAAHGVTASGFAVLLVLPMIWFGLLTTGNDLRAACVLVVLCCFLPPLVSARYGRATDALGPALALSVVTVSVALSLAVLTRETGRLHRELRRAASYDLLSGLLNRRGWEEATQELLQGRSARAQVCVTLIDLDHLKSVNDSMGHDEGDALLRGTGERLRDAFGHDAVVARLGGDEFAILVVGDEAGSVLARLAGLRVVTPARAGYSAGIAFATPGEDLRETMRRADLALYTVKATGRGRDVVADPSLTLDQAEA